MKSLKILHLANIIGEGKGGGIHEVVSNFYRYQKALKNEPSIWYPGVDGDADSIRLDGNIRGLSTFGDLKFGLLRELFEPISKEISALIIAIVFVVFSTINYRLSYYFTGLLIISFFTSLLLTPFLLIALLPLFAGNRNEEI